MATALTTPTIKPASSPVLILDLLSVFAVVEVSVPDPAESSPEPGVGVVVLTVWCHDLSGPHTPHPQCPSRYPPFTGAVVVGDPPPDGTALTSIPASEHVFRIISSQAEYPNLLSQPNPNPQMSLPPLRQFLSHLRFSPRVWTSHRHTIVVHPDFPIIPSESESTNVPSEQDLVQSASSKYSRVVSVVRAVVATGMDRPIARYRRNIIVAVLPSDAESWEQRRFIKSPIAMVEFQICVTRAGNGRGPLLPIGFPSHGRYIYLTFLAWREITSPDNRRLLLDGQKCTSE